MSWHSGDSAIVLPDEMHCFRRKATQAERIYFLVGSYFFRSYLRLGRARLQLRMP
jgi:hypothetical protein